MDKHISLSPCPFCGMGLTLDIDEEGGVAILHSLKGEKNCWFPSIVEIEMPVETTLEEMVEILNRRPIEDGLRAELARKDEQIEKLEDALHKISNWCKAYPLEIADEPTEDEWKTAHAIMNQRGWSLTTFVVSGMRRVTNGIAEIADLGG